MLNARSTLVVLVVALVALAACGEDDRVAEESDAGGETPSEVETSEFLDNRDFDDGTTAPWIQESLLGEPLIVFEPELPVRPHSGGYSAWLAAENGSDDRLSQGFTVPDTAISLTVTFALYVNTEHHSSEPARDLLSVRFVDPDGEPVRVLGEFSNASANDAWQIVRLPDENLDALRGRTLVLEFHATCDGVALTSFFVDTVSVRITYGIAG